MEAGKWIIFAALAGAVLVGFKSRQLKTYEFIVCGLFVLLLDGLVFNGQISKWVGDLGSNLPEVANSITTSGLALWLSPNARHRLIAFGRAMWTHRPGWGDYLFCASLTVIAHYLLGISWWFGLLLAAVLAGATAVNALSATPQTATAEGEKPAEYYDGPGRHGNAERDERHG
ncbi:hypothetical protein [Nonomuraea endophytica]|uniref:Uncharacterized protein n=1 Tax=Nonomuraea endophytica TaxID=714136 RepID=A0A7W8AF70_9ACTN|nr:hypothetical protein [Nonomuraea endophytica]MBB5085049.1 hypothetical protein [Nonomuraea endophytica]